MATTETDRWQGFILYANGEIEEIDRDGESDRWWSEPGLFDDLVLAGFPLTKDNDVKAYDGIIDLSVNPADPAEVTVYVNGTEHRMGAASTLFLGWYQREVIGNG